MARALTSPEATKGAASMRPETYFTNNVKDCNIKIVKMNEDGVAA
jgi:hypothetical protein